MTKMLLDAIEGSLIVAPATIVAAHIFLLLPFSSVLQRLQRNARKSIHLMTASAISDHWKEKSLPVYAGAIAMNALTLGGLLILLATTYGAALYATGKLWDTNFDFAASLQRIDFMVYAIVIATLYLFARKRLKRE